jgi:hypothetical protein
MSFAQPALLHPFGCIGFNAVEKGMKKEKQEEGTKKTRANKQTEKRTSRESRTLLQQ